MADEPQPTLAWPSHDTGPTPPVGSMAAARDERRTRKKLTLWDRLKFVVLLIGLWFLFVWSDMANIPILPFRDAVRRGVSSKWWLLALLGLEVVRQIHYLISEHSARYHGFWTHRIFGGLERRTNRLNDWNRYRLARAFKIALFAGIIVLLLGASSHQSAVVTLFDLPGRIWRASPMFIQLAFALAFGMLQFVGIFWLLSRGGTELYFPDDIKTRFTDVWGQDAVLERVKENIVYLEDPESIESRGGYVPGGILLWGPPGTGKTLMAEAVAGETGKPYMFVDPGAFINMFFGVGILKVKGLFRKLRKLAVRYGGVIVFFDEADSLGNRGSLSAGGAFGGAMAGMGPMGMGAPGPWSHHAGCNGLSYLSPDTASMLARATMQQGMAAGGGNRSWRDRVVMPGGMNGGGGGMGTLQALLTEMSGLKKPRGFFNRVVRRTLGMRPKPPPKYRMLIMMATNMPQALDEALLRPGRIDRIYKVGYPSKAGRVRTYEGYLAKVSHELTPAQIDKLATITPYATGAIIKDMVNEALIQAIRAGRDAITWADIIRAKQLKDLGPPEDVEYIERERHAVAIHEACHAVVAVKVRHHLTIDIATIEKGGTYLGMVASIPPEDQFTRWKSEYVADIMVSLASLAGERIFFDDDNSSGVSGDLSSATLIASMMEGYWGMGQTVTSHGVTHEIGIGGGGRPGRGEGKEGEKSLLEGSLGERIEEQLADILDRTRDLLEENRHLVLAVAHALETTKTLTGEDVVAIIEGTQGPLIDGRPYHDPEFVQLAEAYHQRALLAHKGHASVDLPLPVFARPDSNGNGNGHGHLVAGGVQSASEDWGSGA